MIRRIADQVFSVADCQIRRARSQVDDPAIQAEEEEREIQEDLAAKEAILQADIEEALSTLSERQRRILWLIVDGDMTQRDVAAELNISVSTVNYHFGQARTCLAEKLNKHRPHK